MRRVFDVAFAVVLLSLVAPVLVLAAACIVTEDGGPVFFSHRRVGRYGRTFTIFKLRTMRSDRCRDGFKPTSGSDPRITRVGRILRVTSIDELPQLFNVLRGDMSVIGPRPEMPFIVERYERWQNLRHLVRPGLTCIWQARFRSLPLHDPAATMLDLSYIRAASPSLDVALLWQTVGAVLFRKGAV